jgi:methionyl-tRNA formyltransferase
VLFAAARSDFANAVLEELARLDRTGAIRFAGVVATDRRQKLTTWIRSNLRRLVTNRWRAPTVSTVARRLGIQVLFPHEYNINDEDVLTFIREKQADLLLVFGCDQILRQKLIAACPLVVNYHNSLLPKYRGVGGAIWPYLKGEAESGYTFHTIDDEHIDVGRLVLQASVPMPPLVEAHTYSDRLNEAAAQALPDLIATIAARDEFDPLARTDDYFSGRLFQQTIVADASLTVDEACKRALVMGHLLLRRGPIVLRLQKPNRHRSCWSDLPVSFADGAVWFSRINYLPAILAAPVVSLVFRR